MNIRPATTSDLESIGRIHRESILQLCSSHYSAAQLNDWVAALRPAAYVALLTTHRMFVAQDSAALIGFGVLDPNTALINATYVSPSAARRGIGRALLRAMESEASAAGFGEVRLNATLNAVAFYERLAYVARGVQTNRLPTGTELPCVAMRKDLAART